MHFRRVKFFKTIVNPFSNICLCRKVEKASVPFKIQCLEFVLKVITWLDKWVKVIFADGNVKFR